MPVATHTHIYTYTQFTHIHLDRYTPACMCTHTVSHSGIQASHLHICRGTCIPRTGAHMHSYSHTCSLTGIHTQTHSIAHAHTHRHSGLILPVLSCDLCSCLWPWFSGHVSMGSYPVTLCCPQDPNQSGTSAGVPGTPQVWGSEQSSLYTPMKVFNWLVSWWGKSVGPSLVGPWAVLLAPLSSDIPSHLGSLRSRCQDGMKCARTSSGKCP